MNAIDLSWRTLRAAAVFTGVLLSPAYAEVDCATGLYTGYRFRFWEDPIVHHALLYWGDIFYVVSGSMPECLYA